MEGVFGDGRETSFRGRLLDGEGMSDVCREFGISRKTGYKIFNRYKDDGLGALAAWVNWSMHSDNYDRMARYDMLWDPEKWVDNPPHERGLWVTNWASIVSGIASMIAALFGCAFILHGNFVATLWHMIFG